MFDARQYTVRRQIRPFGSEYVMTAGATGETEAGQEPILHAKQQFRSRTTVRFIDPDGRPVLRVGISRGADRAAPASGGNRGYVVGDDRTESYVGSITRDAKAGSERRWRLYGPANEHVGAVAEADRLRRLVPRTLQSVLPFAYSIRGVDGEVLGTVRRTWSRRDRVHVDLTPDTENRLDPRLAMAAVTVDDRTGIADPS